MGCLSLSNFFVSTTLFVLFFLALLAICFDTRGVLTHPGQIALHVIGIFAVYRMRIRPTEDNPDSQFTAMPQTITPTGMELNPSTEPIEEPKIVEKDKNII